jgi:site-specific DNA recombinase
VNPAGPAPLLHPNTAEICRQRISALYERLQNDDGRPEAAENFLVDKVTLLPSGNELGIVFPGDLGRVLN